MKWNPYLSAFSATAYIGLVVLFIHFLESIRHDTPDTLLDGMGALSLLVFSAAVMAFLFFYQPVLLMVEYKPTEAVRYFLKTLATFGVTTLIIITLLSLQ